MVLIATILISNVLYIIFYKKLFITFSGGLNQAVRHITAESHVRNSDAERVRELFKPSKKTRQVF